jgi:hypothetical protein
MTDDKPDPLVSGIKSAAVHVGKAGFELLAAAGAIASAISQKVRSDDDLDGDGDGGRERVDVD